MPATPQTTLLHVDMDAFFAAVEQRDNPALRGKPVIVGSPPDERGVVSTCSYEARKFGVRSAMPSRTAYALCPSGIFVKPRMRAYREASAQVFSVFERFTPFVEAVSVDEAFLDVTGSLHLFGGRVPLAEKLRAAVAAECSLTCSVGIAPNRLLAKIGSEQRKPNGLFEMPFDPPAIRAFLAPKPISILWGVGAKTSELLAKYGFRTCGDLQSADPRFLERILGPSAAASIARHALGESAASVNPDPPAEKSVSREFTFPEDASSRDAVRQTLLDLADEVGWRFRLEPNRRARTAKIKLRDSSFDTITRQASFDLPARDNTTFRHKALELFDAAWPPSASRSIRLVGFGVSGITESDSAPPPSLFGPDPRVAERDRRERLSAALDALRRATGPSAE